jgi:hypothetical protein
MNSLIFKASLLCALSYKDSTLPFLDDYVSVKHFKADITDTEAFIMEDETFIYVVFPGTEFEEGLSDLITCAKFANRKQFHKLRLHRGFWEAWADISSQVTTELIERNFKAQYDGRTIKPIVFTGHSLGGALATIGAATVNPTHCITFGSPHVGGKVFVDYIEHMRCQFTRVTHVKDPVPTALSWHPHYHHVGQHICYDMNMDAHLNPSWLRRLFLRLSLPTGFRYHDTSQYLGAAFVNASGAH